MPAGLGTQPGLWVIASDSFSSSTWESRILGSLPSHWENWSAAREEEEHQWDAVQVLGEDGSHTPSLWVCSNDFQQSVKAVKGVLEEPVGSKVTGKEKKNEAPMSVDVAL